MQHFILSGYISVQRALERSDVIISAVNSCDRLKTLKLGALVRLINDIFFHPTGIRTPGF